MKKKIRRILWMLLCAAILSQNVSAATLLTPVGQVIGLELEDDSVTVAAFDSTLGHAARDAGIRVGDRLLSVNQQPIRCAGDVRSVLAHSDGAVELSILRDGKIKTLRLTPAISEEGPKLGVFLREGIAGIGTVTWYNPDSGAFGALGHGVSRPDGQPVKMIRGSACQARILSVQKGLSGEPGQLLGAINSDRPIGSLSQNTAQGVFGTASPGWPGEPIPIAAASEIQKGPAVIRSTIAGTEPAEYSVEILKIYSASGAGERNMLLKITDPVLLEATGGIVQGMSGSPIIQNGRLIGAVTHVLVNDPTRGYGIFIENMLDAAG